MITMLRNAVSAIHQNLAGFTRAVFATATLALAVGAIDSPIMAVAHAEEITAPTSSDIQSVGNEEGGRKIISTANKALKYYFAILGILFVGALAWAGWQTKQDKDVAPLKWTFIGGVIFAMAGGFAKLIISWL